MFHTAGTFAIFWNALTIVDAQARATHLISEYHLNSVQMSSMPKLNLLCCIRIDALKTATEPLTHRNVIHTQRMYQSATTLDIRMSYGLVLYNERDSL